MHPSSQGLIYTSMAASQWWDSDEENGGAQMKTAKTFLRFVWKNKLVALSFLVLGSIMLGAVFLDALAPYDPYLIEISMRNQPPGVPAIDGQGTHLLGTDPLGRDVLSRIMLGSQVSMSVGITSVLISGALGTTLGLIAGYYRGWVDTLVMRLVDIQMSVPSLLIALLVLYILGPSFFNVVLVLAITRWMVYARVARGLILSLRETLFVEAARSLGASDRRIIVKHLLPNISAPILVLGTLEFAVMLLTEASLSFLGLGIQAPESSWGLMLAEGRTYLTTAWWLVAMPGLAILLSTLSVNIIAIWLRQKTMDQRGRRSTKKNATEEQAPPGGESR
jgi:peptide/nickel transport system permease protein